MISQKWVSTFQLVGAALGIPAAAAGSYSAYQNYFSNEAACQKLRTNIISTMERKLANEIKRSLLRKDVTEFEKTCAEGDPDAHTVFRAALHETEPRVAMSATRSLGGAVAQADGSAAAKADPAAPFQRRQLGAFGASGESHGWVALSRHQAKAWVANFSGYSISESSLPPAGTVLTAQHKMPVWSEVQAGTNDQTKLQSMLAAGACVRVLTSRVGTGRLWAEVVPSSCS